MDGTTRRLRRITWRLYPQGLRHGVTPVAGAAERSVVAFLLRPSGDGGEEVLLTRRSPEVRQPGDLCCPGGGAEPALDRAIAGLLRLPGSPLTRWPLWARWRADTAASGRPLARVLATALRECIEEIRLWPFGVQFLGLLPLQELVLFKKAITPVVFWVPRQRRFWPNWEVDAMVPIAIAQLLKPERYLCYRIKFNNGPGQADFHGFRYDGGTGATSVLWGATFRMTMDYLRIVHGFAPPALSLLPVVTRTIGSDYLTGSRLRTPAAPPSNFSSRRP